MKLIRQIAYLIILFFTLSACSREPKIEGGHLMTIESRSVASPLFYLGIVSPLKTRVVTSPADGAVVEMPFQYGEEVKASQLLFMLSSAKFMTDYKTALMQYIKAKNDFNNGQIQLKEAEFLHKNQLISDDDYTTRKSNFYGSQLALLQAKDALENLLKQLNIKDADLYKLSIADIDKITQAMHLQMNTENLRILAPAAGIILAPNKGEEENKKVIKGDVVKQGDVLAVIGDMSGLSVRIKVNELTVNQLRVGQKVKVTGIAFPGYELKGEIKRIDRQGEAASSGLPTFSAEVVVPTITSEQQKEIHVGMTAKVEINVEEGSQMVVPISALSEKNGISYVKRYEDKTKKIHDVAVKTGKTTMDSVVILSGLNSGDKIVVAG